MKIKWSKGKIFVLAITALIAVHFVFFRAPSESQMIARFHAHKAELEQLRLMLAHDENVRIIGPDWTQSKSEFDSQERWTRDLPLDVSNVRLALYRHRMKNLGITNLYVYDQKHQIHFSLFGGGFADTTWDIGYAWSKETPKPLVKSAYYQMPGREGIHFSRIEGDWYIYNRH